MALLRLLFLTMCDLARSRARLQVELLAVRHQLHVLERTRPRRVRLSALDRWLWVSLSRLWSEWRRVLVIVGSVRRECLDHVIVCSKAGLRRTLHAYYLRSRTYLALNKDAPVSRPVLGPGEGTIVAVPQVGALHHHYERRAA